MPAAAPRAAAALAAAVRVERRWRQPAPGGGGAARGGRTPPLDSLDEDWSTGQISSTLGADAEVRVDVRIVDEDRKVNLLSLFTPEAVDAQGRSYREAAKDRIVRLIDEFRDGMPGDVSTGDARKIVDNIIAWCDPISRDEKKFPKPPLKSNEEDSSQDKFNLIESQKVPVLPMSMEELMMVDGIDDKLFYGFEKDGQWVPGLEDVLTIYTHLEMGEAPVKKDDTFKLPDSDADASKDGGGSSAKGGSSGSGSSGSGDAQDGGSDASGAAALAATNQGRININTASMAVIRSMAPQNFPETLLDDFDKWREKELKRLKEEREKAKDQKSKFASVDTDLGGDKSERPYPLESVDQLDEIPEWKETGAPSGNAKEEDPRDVFKHFFTTHSNVFRVDVRVWKPNRTRIKVLRAILWRRMDGDKATVVPVIPLQERSLLGIDLIDLKKAREEQQQSSS
ncbi:MAG: type II secretion system protein GspK [Planctomycetota bacterium]